MWPECKGSSLFVLILLLLSEPTANGQDHRPAVVVYVYNNAKVPESVLTETGRYVEEMFAKAGIELVWLNSMARVRSRSDGIARRSTGQRNGYICVRGHRSPP